MAERGMGSGGRKERPDATRRREVSRPEGFTILYTNSVEIDLTPWDVRLRLGQISEATRERLALNEIAHVYMSPQHAKALLRALDQVVATYEARYGELRLPAREPDHEASPDSTIPH